MHLSNKQRDVFRFFNDPTYDMLIADGAVRSGKTFALLHGFLLWSLNFAPGHDFGLAGRTIGTLKRNVIYPYIVPLQKDPIIRKLGGIRLNMSGNFFTLAGRTFNWFGGDKETSQFLIQGKTLAGIFFDEVAALLRSFVDQGLARCSVEGAKMVFSCNSSHPNHYFKTDFIDKAADIRALYTHWTMGDNPSLSEAVKERYRRMFTGVFYERNILGRWVAAEGVVFLQFANDPERWILDKPHAAYTRLFIGVDFGGSKAKTVFVLVGICDTDAGPQAHVLNVHVVKDRGCGIDEEQISREHLEFLERATADYGIKPHATYVDHLDTLRVGMQKKCAHLKHRVIFCDKSISLGEWAKLLNSMFNLNMLKMLRRCAVAIEAFKGLLYDDKKDDDRPLDDNVTCDVDTYDATRYGLAPVMRDWLRRGVLAA